MDQEVWKASTRPQGDLTGVYEFDDSIGYFYLYDDSRTDGNKILGAILIGPENPGEDAIEVVWNGALTKVGLTIKGKLWAFFDTNALNGVRGRFDSRKDPPDLDATFHDC